MTSMVKPEFLKRSRQAESVRSATTMRFSCRFRQTERHWLPTWLTRFAGRQSLNLCPLLGPLLGPLLCTPFLQHYFTITSKEMLKNLLTIYTFKNRKEHGRND